VRQAAERGVGAAGARWQPEAGLSVEHAAARPLDCSRRPWLTPRRSPTATLPGFGAAALMAPLLQNLCLSLGDNEEACFCLKAWQVQGPRARGWGALPPSLVPGLAPCGCVLR
jgi:hypothetical protein